MIDKKEQLEDIYDYIDKARVCGVDVRRHGNSKAFQ